MKKRETIWGSKGEVPKQTQMTPTMSNRRQVGKLRSALLTSTCLRFWSILKPKIYIYIYENEWAYMGDSLDISATSVGLRCKHPKCGHPKYGRQQGLPDITHLQSGWDIFTIFAHVSFKGILTSGRARPTATSANVPTTSPVSCTVSCMSPSTASVESRFVSDYCHYEIVLTIV